METCIFCKIIKGEIKSDIRYQDNNVIAFNDIHPKARVHVLIVPKAHISDIQKISENQADISTLFMSVPKVAKRVGIEKGYKLCVNYGTYQEVPHLHLHLMAD